MKSDMATQSEGKIVEWDQAKGFGYLRSGKRKLFLHRRDFSEHHKKPEVGDSVRFTIGSDAKPWDPASTGVEPVERREDQKARDQRQTEKRQLEPQLSPTPLRRKPTGLLDASAALLTKVG